MFQIGELVHNILTAAVIGAILFFNGKRSRRNGRAFDFYHPFTPVFPVPV